MTMDHVVAWILCLMSFMVLQLLRGQASWLHIDKYHIINVIICIVRRNLTNNNKMLYVEE